MKLYCTRLGVVLEAERDLVLLPEPWDAVVMHENPPAFVRELRSRGRAVQLESHDLLAPVDTQEVWAAGVTYLRSRAARVEESEDAGGGSFYDRVYSAARPELFFKCAGWRVRAPGAEVRIRRDARWNVPEPEIALCINPHGCIVGYTIGNDMSSRDIEGENPLYLPQAKIYDGACALGPALLLTETLLPTTAISLRIRRAGVLVCEAQTEWQRMQREPRELVHWLYRETSFPHGCVLLTGTGIVPPDDFTLCAGDQIEITVPPIGTLHNMVASS